MLRPVSSTTIPFTEKGVIIVKDKPHKLKFEVADDQGNVSGAHDGMQLTARLHYKDGEPVEQSDGDHGIKVGRKSKWWWW